MKTMYPEEKKQTEDNVDGYVRSTYDVIQITTQFSEESRTIILILQIFGGGGCQL